MSIIGISETKLKARLGESVGLFVLEKTESTNSCARELGERGFDNTLVVAKDQTAGRGTKGRSFFCKGGEGLYMSYLYRTIEQQVNVTALAAVAVAEAVRSVCGVDAKIKWVNDIVVNDKKLCGILCETKNRPDFSPEFTVIGVGINIAVESFPTEISDRAVSLHTLCGGIDANELAAETSLGIKRLLSENDHRGVMERYRELSSVLGREVYYTKGGGERSGTAVRIEEDGSLTVASGGNEARLISSDVSIKLSR